MTQMTAHNVFGYPEPVWARFSAPRHAGRLAMQEGVIHVSARSVAARSQLQLSVQRVGDAIREARFLAYGCPVAIAVGDWLAETLPGQAAADWQRLDAARLTRALEIPADKAHCALMGEDLIQELRRRWA